MRSHRRRHPVDHVLIAGRGDDLDGIRAALAILPGDAYGQVLLEAPASAVPDLATPPRITVHHLDAGNLPAAIAGWIAEWVPDEPDPQREVAIWIGDHARLDPALPGLDGLAERL